MEDPNRRGTHIYTATDVVKGKPRRRREADERGVTQAYTQSLGWRHGKARRRCRNECSKKGGGEELVKELGRGFMGGCIWHIITWGRMKKKNSGYPGKGKPERSKINRKPHLKMLVDLKTG